MMHFYVVLVADSCPCGKAVTHEVFGPGNASYGKYCKNCAIKKEKSLTEYWNKQSIATQEAQLRDTRHDR